MTAEQMKAYIAKLEAEKAALAAKLEAKAHAAFSLKVSELGAVSIYGFGRWPVTLYPSQVESLLSKAEDIRKFIADNKDKLSTGKDDPRFKAVRDARKAAQSGVKEI